VRIPDDISELADDIEAYRRELRAAARRARARRRRAGAPAAIRWLLPTGKPPAPGFEVRERRYLLPMIVTATALVLSTIVVGLLTLLAPSHPAVVRRPAPEASTSVPVGTAGGLMPDLQLDGADGRAVALRSVRPAVVVLLPADCQCTTTVESIAQDAQSQQVALAVVTRTSPGQTAPAEVESVQGLRQLDDPTGQVGQAFDESHLAAIVVRADGTVSAVVTGDALVTDLSDDLQQDFAGV
jgi:hypothetical protein